MNEFVKSSSIQYMYLDNSPVKHIVLDSINIIINTYSEELDSKPKLSRIRDYTYFKERFYVYDNIRSSIFMVFKNGDIEGPFTSQGRGPGEHDVTTTISSNSKYIYLPDWNNARINIYNHDMILVKEISNFKGVYKTKYIDVNDRIMLFSNPKKAGFVSQAPLEGLISISDISNPADTIATILPQIIPDGYQPQIYNRPNFSLNRKNEIAASYAPLPWIFLFDDKFNLKLTLILNYSVLDEMDIPDMDIFKPAGNEGFGGVMPLRKFKLMDNGDIFISIGSELIHLSYDSSGSYRPHARYRFYTLNEDEPLWISNLFSTGTEGVYYAGNWDYLFQINLPE